MDKRILLTCRRKGRGTLGRLVRQSWEGPEAGRKAKTGSARSYETKGVEAVGPAHGLIVARKSL